MSIRSKISTVEEPNLYLISDIENHDSLQSPRGREKEVSINEKIARYLAETPKIIEESVCYLVGRPFDETVAFLDQVKKWKMDSIEETPDAYHNSEGFQTLQQILDYKRVGRRFLVTYLKNEAEQLENVERMASILRGNSVGDEDLFPLQEAWEMGAFRTMEIYLRYGAKADLWNKHPLRLENQDLNDQSEKICRLWRNLQHFLKGDSTINLQMSLYLIGGNVKFNKTRLRKSETGLAYSLLVGDDAKTVTILPKKIKPIGIGTTSKVYRVCGVDTSHGTVYPYTIQSISEKRFTEIEKTLFKVRERGIIETFQYGEYLSSKKLGLLNNPKKLFYKIQEELIPFDWCLRKTIMFSAKQVVRLVGDAFAGQKYLHDNDILHEDNKPANLFLYEEGSNNESDCSENSETSYRAVLGDFNLSRHLKDEPINPVTNNFYGSVVYAPPEQIEAFNQKTGKESDVYALALSFYYYWIFSRTKKRFSWYSTLIEYGKQMACHENDKKLKLCELREQMRCIRKEIVKLNSELKCLVTAKRCKKDSGFDEQKLRNLIKIKENEVEQIRIEMQYFVNNYHNMKENKLRRDILIQQKTIGDLLQNYQEVPPTELVDKLLFGLYNGMNPDPEQRWTAAQMMTYMDELYQASDTISD